MIADPEHQAVADLLGAYALDAVEPAEVQHVEEHLGSCPRCREEVDQLRTVAAGLGNLSEQPPARVWDRIAAGVGSLAPDPGSRQLSSATPAKPATSLEGPAMGSVVQLAEGRARKSRRRRTWAATMTGAAAALAIAVLASGLVQANGRVHQLQSALAGRAPDAAVRAALASRGHTMVSLRTTAGTTVARIVLAKSGVGYVVSSAMSALPASETYQLWASINGRPISLGLLGRRPQTGAAFSLGSAAVATRELMVTVEPAGGLVAPDRSPIATARVSTS